MAKAHENSRMPPASTLISLPGDYGTSDFILKRSGKLPNVQIAYETWGKLSPNKDNAILVFTGLSPSAHAASSSKDPENGWWEYMIGDNKPIDTKKFFVICVNSLGSCYGSTSPESINPATNKPYGLDFPELAIEDIAKAGHHTVNALDINHLHSVVGGSMGAMSALAYALQYSGEFDNLIIISGACRALPFTIAVRSLQREIIRCDPTWNNGDYYDNESPLQGMKLARKLGLMSYRANEEWREKFNRARVAPQSKVIDKFSIEFEVEKYLDYNAEKFVKVFDPNSYLYLSRAMDIFDVADHGGSVKAGLSKIHAKKALVVGVETDILFPLEQQVEIADGLKLSGTDVVLEKLRSIQGHDSFLIDSESFSPVVQKFLEKT